MANIEDEFPNFDDLKLPDEELFPAEPAGEPAISDEPAAEPIEAEGAPSETERAEPAEAQDERTTDEAAKAPSKLPVYVEWGCVIGIPVLLLVLAVFHALYFSTAIYVISVGFIPYGIWKGRETNTVYTVILACALAAVLTAIYCLWLEVGRYQFDIKAREAKQRVGMSWPADAQLLAQNGVKRSAVGDQQFA